MAKSTKNIPSKKTSNPIADTKKATPKPVASFSLFNSLENHFSQRNKFYLWALVFIAVLFSILCFDVKISTANDDALYIEAGSNYAKNFFGYFYTANAPLYPIILGFFIKLFGMKLIGMKIISILFFAAGIYFSFRAFEHKIPYMILIPALLITAINFPFLMYASLTYSETFSFFIFSLGFYFVNKYVKDEDETPQSDMDIWWAFVLFGFLFFVQMITRNVALISISVLCVYLIYRKRYIGTAITAVTFGFFYVLYKLALKFLWKIDGSQFSSQYERIFQKDAYRTEMGKENFWGFVTRFFENCHIYISSQLMYVLGFREESQPKIAIITWLFIGLLIWAIYTMWKNKQHVLLFSTLFFCGLLSITFITLQTSWAQTRLIMIYLPFILFAYFYLFYYYSKKIEVLQYLYAFLIIILFFSGFGLTAQNMKDRIPTLITNITEDPTAGYTPDWQNYIKMSQWCAQNLPNETKQIAVRKAPMSFIFTEGKEFYGIYSTPYQDADSLLTPLRQQHVNYIMDARLRINPSSYIENQFISTIYRYMYFIVQKYPNALTQIQQVGDIEEARLYKINWNYIDSLKNATPKIN